MADFDVTPALIGGALLGLSATLLMLLLGRIAGISGILSGCFHGLRVEGHWRNAAWRVAFILGLISVPPIVRTFGYDVAPPQLPQSWSLLVVAGLLVGFGTRLGGGCTSGHGVCGVARLSPRSLIATVVFVTTAAIVVAVMRHS